MVYQLKRLLVAIFLGMVQLECIVIRLRTFSETASELVSLTGVPAAGQRHAPVLIERTGSYLDPRRRVAASYLGFVDAAQHVGDHSRVEAGFG